MPPRTPQLNEVFGQHLRSLRKERKLTQEALAERADLGVNIVARLERAMIAPGLLTILKLSIALGVTAGELLAPFTPGTLTRMRLLPSRSGSRQTKRD